MLYNAKLAQDVARGLFAEGVYAVGFFFPVVAKGQASIARRCRPRTRPATSTPQSRRS